MIVNPPLGAARPEQPYPGLRPFEASEWSIFFGRERMVDDVIERLAHNRLVLIHGASGSGKSSLVRAGIMPKLARQHQRHGAPWLTCAMRPSGGPLWNLAAEFARLEGRADDVDRIGAIQGLFNRRDASLASVAGALEGLADKSLCILVDQFEELFRFEKETSREEAELFVDLIARVAAQAGGDPAPDAAGVHVILTMRSEFLGDCARFDGLAETINQTQYLVPRMNDEALMRAVRRPAQMFNGFVSQALAGRLIASVRGREDELPLLQHGLMLMWDEAAARARPGERRELDGAMVDAAGGLAELLSGHADKVMDSVAPDERRGRCVEMMFRELTDVNAEGSAIRRPRSFRDLVEAVGATPEELRPIIDAFRAPRVSFLTPYAPAPILETTIIDISHEALIRCWRRIASGQDGWLKQEFDDGLAWRSLLVEANAFTMDRRRVLSAAATVDRTRLFSARNELWSKRYGGGWPAVENLLKASRRAALRTRLIAVTAMVSLAVLTVGALAMAAKTSVALRQAKAARHIAVANQQMAESQDKLSRSLLDQLTDNGRSCPRVVAADQSLTDEAQIAAERGNVGASYMLGLLYNCGVGVPQDYVKAREWYERAAAAGNSVAMSNIGILYYNGRGAPQDYAKAREWYEKAADAGNARAMSNIGILYYGGYGVAQDYAKAREWYEKGAAAGNAIAMSNIGALYESGTGVAQDYVQARTWYEKSARAGNPPAMRNIGLLYERGRGAPQDYVMARQWYGRAAAVGDSAAMTDIGILYQNGRGAPQDYAMAREWYEKGAAAGDVAAMTDIGVLYEDGLGTSRDYVKAREWYEKAAAAGNAPAMSNIGYLYQNGRGAPQDYAMARGWYEKAAAAGNAPAMSNVGVLYENGMGAQQDYAKAREWYEKAADAGNAPAMSNIGLLYENGRGVPQDYVKAREWYEKASAAGNTTAMINVGALYLKGHGAAQDFGKAREWYEKAAAAGNAEAMRDIGLLYDNANGVAQDYPKAREWYEKAAAAGDRIGARYVGDFYNNGQGVAQDYASAREWYEKAAGGGDAVAMRAIGLMYDNGHGVTQDYTRARIWYEKGAAAGDAVAMRDAGLLYDNGHGVAQDYVKAREWYQKAAAAGDMTGMRYIGDFYDNGQGVPKDYVQAREWYEKAAAAGDAFAMTNIGALYQNGYGVAQDDVRAREWFSKAAALGNASATQALAKMAFDEKRRAISREDAAGHYAEALSLQEQLAAEIEADEIKTDGKAGARAASELSNVSWQALSTRDFSGALAAAERAHALAPGDLVIETNRAHALMFLGRTQEARALYLAHKDERVSNNDNKTWRQSIAGDFAEFRKQGLISPLMDEIEAALAAVNQ
jgi:uncharacterized protein